jgi:FlaA1/EpsC-like NDP-sugar epimerase
VIVLGAGNARATLARELSRSGEWRLVGLLDDDPAEHGREIYAHKVLGPVSDLAHWAEALRVEQAIIAIPSASVDTRRRVATLTRWRERLGEAGIEELLAETIEAAKHASAIKASSAKRVIVDTTVMQSSA